MKPTWLAGLVAVTLALAAVCCDVNVQLGVSPHPDAAATADATADAADAAD